MNTESAADKSHRRYGCAIMRLDLFQLPDGKPNTEQIKTALTVRNVVPDADTADQEVVRLNRLNADKDCVYYWVGTRLDGSPDDYKGHLTPWVPDLDPLRPGS